MPEERAVAVAQEPEEAQERTDSEPISSLRRSRVAGIEDRKGEIREAGDGEPQDEDDDESPATAAEPVEAQSEPAWLQHVRDVPLNEIMTYRPDLRQDYNGRIGSEAQRIAQQQAQALLYQQLPTVEQRIRAQVRQEMDDAELSRLRKDDPFQYAERVEQREQRANEWQTQQRAAAVVHQTAQQAALGHVFQVRQQIAQQHANRLSHEDATYLAQQQFAPGIDGVEQYIQAASALELQRERERLEATYRTQQKLETALRPAVRKDVLGEANAGASPDMGGQRGSSASGNKDWNWYLRQPLDERLRIRNAEPALYNRLFNSQ